MKMQVKNGGLGLAAMVLCLGGTALAQSGIRPHQTWGNLENDIVEHPSYQAWQLLLGPHRAGRPGDLTADLSNDMVSTGGALAGRRVRDGGTVFVDLTAKEGLELSFEASEIVGGALRSKPGDVPMKKVRLAGGTPGFAGGVMVSLNEPQAKISKLRGGAVISGSFGMDGSIVVELPADLDQTVYVQGFEVTRLGGAYSGILRIDPNTAPAPAIEASFEASPISSAVHRALKGQQGEQPIRLRFFGAASIGDLQRAADVTVVLSKEKDSFALYMGRDLAEAAAVVDLNGEPGRVRFYATEPELSDAVEALVFLEAFSDMAQSSGRPTISLPVVASKSSFSQATAPTTQVEVGVDLGAAAELEVSGWDAQRLHLNPRRAQKNDDSKAKPFTGPIHDGGTVTVDPSSDDEQLKVGGWDAQRLHLNPRRAQKNDDSKAKPFTGPIHDGGTVTVDLPGDDAQLEVGGWDARRLHLNPHRARKDAGPKAKPSTGPVRDAGTRLR